MTRRESHGATHVGRGGTGNVVSADEVEVEEAQMKQDESAVADEEETKEPGWAERSKQFLFGKR